MNNDDMVWIVISQDITKPIKGVFKKMEDACEFIEKLEESQGGWYYSEQWIIE